MNEDLFGMGSLDSGYGLDLFSSADLKMPSNPFGATEATAGAKASKTAVSGTGAGMMAAGHAFAAISDVMGGFSKAKADKQQAAQDRYNALQTYLQGQVETNIQRQKADLVVGRATAGYSASGVDVGSGSAAQEIQQSSMNAFQDAANIQKTFAAKADSLNRQAQIEEDAANSDGINGVLSGLGQGAMGLASLLMI